ncbi:MAG: hypothetical protein HFE49_00690 [Clostridia bacterium]|nr:hypothetical protein [Clostridia bacterium]
MLYTENVIFNTNKVKENAIDILDSMDNYVLNDGIYIQSLKQSQQRTIVIVRHIEKMLDIYRVLCARDKETPEAQRRYEVIYDRYIAPEQKSIKEIADCKNMSTRAVYINVLTLSLEAYPVPLGNHNPMDIHYCNTILSIREHCMYQP